MSIFRHPILKIFYWVIAEIILNLIGFDDLADYSEFILHKRVIFSEVITVEQHNDTHQVASSIPLLPTTVISEEL
jgi:hypothetical protein